MPDDRDRLSRPSAVVPDDPGSIVGWVRAGVIDAELAGLLWLLLDGNVPLLIASRDDVLRRARRVAVVADMLSATQPTARIVQATDVARLVDAAGLGWLDEPGPVPGGAGVQIAPGEPSAHDHVLPPAVLVADELGPALGRRWRAAVRVLVRAPSRGFGLVSSVASESLEGVHASLRSLQTALTEDEISYLGVVLVVGTSGAPGAPSTGVDRVTVAHYLRPVARDAHGHVRRFGPAVLASFDPAAGSFEHFAWGIYPELAARIGVRPGDVEAEQERRAGYLAGLSSAAVVDRESVRAALDGYRRDAAFSHAH